MSGAELALAIIPLVIVLIEHHPTVWRKTRALGWSKSKNEQQLDFFQELHAELSLLDVVLDNVKAASNGVGSEVPQAQQISNALGKHAADFQHILERVLKSISDLVREKSSAVTSDDTRDPYAMLRRLRQFEVAVQTKASKTTLRERFRFTKNEKTRSVAMKRIRDGNERLGRMLGMSMAIFDHQSRPTRRRTSEKRMRRFPADLHAKMMDKWPRACACGTRHVAKLCLWNCCCVNDDRHGSDESLDMIFAMPTGEPTSTKWQESTFHIADSNGPGDNEDGVNHVHFQNVPEPLHASPAPQVSDIESQSFCEMLRKAQSRNSSLQILFDDGKLWQKRSTPSCLQIGTQAGVSLKDLLGQSQGWRFEDKSILAVVLAHAVLHCSEGPWLRADWNKQHVSFFQTETTRGPDLTRPYLTMDFTETSETNEDTDLFMLHSNPTLLSLGILLLEISKGIHIEDCWSPEDLTDGRDENESTNLTAALRLLENSDKDLVIGYRKAVKACLEWDTVVGGSGESVDFARRLYECVVRPLEVELKHGFDLTPEQLCLKGRKRGREGISGLH